MSTHLLLEAAARSLGMGAIILVALRLMRIEHVRARRTAWLLALAGALAMPILVSAQIGPRLLPELAILTPRATPSVHPQALRFVHGDYLGHLTQPSDDVAQETQVRSSRPTLDAADDRDPATPADTVLSLAVLGYCIVAAMLSLRLCAGIGFALRLRNQAERVIFSFDPNLDVRISERVKSPVTIGPSVLLPENYTTWDAATLRIVLSHERAHVRQQDFFIQALAGLHCVLFWFNPFSWWLQRQLAELGEALSDCAAVEQAESRSGYAEILLSFATRTRWPLSGVAMASAGNLTPRIERLLNDQGFERSFAKTRSLPFIAAGVVSLAMFASTSMVRATDTTPANPLAPPAAPAAPITPATPSAAGSAAAAAPSTPAPPKKLVRVRKLANIDFNSDAEAGAADTVIMFDSGERLPAQSGDYIYLKLPNIDSNSDAEAGAADTVIEHDDAANDEEGVLAVHSGHSNIMFDSGERLPAQSGDYIYFRHNGKPYMIQDPQIIAKTQALLEPMKKELRGKQKMLRDEQRTLGAQQRMLRSQERAIKLAESPEFKHQMAELQKTIKELDLPRLTAQIDEKALAEVQAHLGEIQASIGELQSEFGAQQGHWGEEQGKLGEQQGKLGQQQALLGEQQRKIVEQVQRQLKPIIEQAISEGKATPLEAW